MFPDVSLARFNRSEKSQKSTEIYIEHKVIHNATMTTISIRSEDDFVEDIERTMKGHKYATRAEFIREAIRDKIRGLEKDEALERLRKAYGAGMNKGRKISDKDIHKAGEEAVKEIAEGLSVELKHGLCK